MKFIAYFFVKKKIHPFTCTLFLKHGQWFLSFGKECFKRMCNRLGGKHALIFHEEVWFMSFSAFHNVILKWKLKMKMYEVDIHVLIFRFFVWDWGGGWLYKVFVIWWRRLFLLCEGSFANIMFSSYVLWLFWKWSSFIFWILTEWYSYHAYSVWSFIWLCSDFLTRYCSEQKASLS